MRKVCTFLLLYTLILPGSSVGALELAEDIEACLTRNLPQSTSAQSVELRARDRGGYESVLQADVYWKRFDNNTAKVLMYLHEPADVRGARFLIVQNEPENDLYIYMPGLFKVRKITSSNITNSMLGTDFSYEDFERIQGVINIVKAEQRPDEVLDGRPVHVVSSNTREDSGYAAIINYIDIETCVALKTELQETGGHLRKRITTDPGKIRKTGGIHVPMEVVITDLRDKTKTTMAIDKISIGIELDDDLFNPEYLKEKKAPPIVTQ